jgi:hypothetical protein
VKSLRTVFLAAIGALALAGAAKAEATADAPAKPPMRLHLSDDRAIVVRPYARGSAAEDPIEAKTAVDHRFGREGPVGQAGYLCGIGGIGPDNDAPRGGPASAFEHFGTFLGASVGYAFR